MDSYHKHFLKSQSAGRSKGLLAGFVFAGCMLMFVAGCSLFNREASEDRSDVLKSLRPEAVSRDKVEQPPSPKSSVPEKVRFDGGLLLGDTDNLAFQPADFAELLVDLVEEGKTHSLRDTIKSYPDLTLNIIRERKLLSGSHLAEVVRHFDELWQGEGKAGWTEMVSSLESPAVSTLLDKRAEFLELLTNNKPKAALALKLNRLVTAQTPTLLKVEVLRIEGIAALMMEDDKLSIARFESARNQIVDSHPYLASQIALLLGEAHRHAGQQEEWKLAWKQAIELQSRWLVERDLYDPAFWKKAAFLRPAREDWPVVVVERIKSKLAAYNIEFTELTSGTQEAVVWALIGVQSLKRHESQNAILAFKKAEALVASPALKQELQMQQAAAMIDGGQPGPASAILLRLSSGKNLLADRAKAVLATLKLQNGSIAQGMNLLQSSIKTSSSWPVQERLKAEADFALALLMRGREKEGIALLEQVQAGFLANKNYEHASQCLWNLAKYYEKTNQARKSAAVVSRLQKLESTL